MKSDAKCFCLNRSRPISTAILFCSLLKIPFLRKATTSSAPPLIHSVIDQEGRDASVSSVSLKTQAADKTLLHLVSGNTL